MENKELEIQEFFDLDVEEYLNKHVPKARVGGYSKRHVEQYFSELNKDMIAMKENLERQLKDVTLENNSLVQEIEVLREQLKEAEMKNATLWQALEAEEAGETSLHLAEENVQLRGELERRNKDLMQKDNKLGEMEVQLKQEIEKVEEMSEVLETMQNSPESVQRKTENTAVKKEASFLELLTQKWNEYKEEKQELAKKINFLEASRMQIRMWCEFVADLDTMANDEKDVQLAEYQEKSQKQSLEMRKDFEKLIKDEVTIEQLLSNMTFMEEMNQKSICGLGDNVIAMNTLSKYLNRIVEDEEVRLAGLQETTVEVYSGDLNVFKTGFEDRQKALNTFIKEKMDYRDRMNRYAGIFQEIEKEKKRLEDICQMMEGNRA